MSHLATGKIVIEDDQERNTILAALRWYECSGFGDPQRQPDWVFDIASDGDTNTTLNDEAIDHLCQRINCG